MKRTLHTIGGIVLLMILGVSLSMGRQIPERVEMENGRIKLVIERRDDGLHELYFVKKKNSWKMILESGSSIQPDPALRLNGNNVTVAFRDVSVARHFKDEQAVHLDVQSNEHTICKRISLRKGDPFARVDISYRIETNARLGFLLSTYSFAPDGKKYSEYKPLDFIFTPQLRPEPTHVIADHTFRSPALIMQEGTCSVALVPDVQMIDMQWRVIKSTADVQVGTSEKPLLSYGLQNWLPEPYQLRNTHVYYSTSDTLAATLRDTTVSYGFQLFLDADAPPRRGFQQIVRYYWNETGSQNIQQPKGPQTEPFATYIKKAWYEFLPQIALDAEYQGKPVTLLRQGRLAWSNKLHKAADNDAWFNVWFNSLRTAYGMYLHGKSVADSKLMDQATRVLNLALLAPQKNGIAPSIFYRDSTGGHWVADHAWGGIGNGDYLPMFHNAWTSYWLLQWIDLAPGRKDEIIRYTTAFADFLLAHQAHSGVIPSWYNPETLKPAKELRDENAETAGAAFFLSEFYKRTGKEKYLHASERAMSYIFDNILPERKWFDFETFFSCSRKSLGFYDSFTGQHPQNTLSLHQAAEACYELYKLTKRNMYRERGTEIMDYLCLFQQVWSPKWLSRELFGGFGVQNTDAEWSDSRQGYFAVSLMNYYELTGKREYFERGVAALRAMFSLFESPTSPRTAENYAHSGLDRPAGVTGIHWGTGSSVVSIHIITKRYGDAYINVKDQWGAGIDGCRIPGVLVKGTSMSAQLLDNVSTPRTVKVKFDKLDKPKYSVTINGKELGTFSAQELQEGISVAI